MGSLHSGFWVIIVPFSFPWLVARSLIPSLSPFPTPVNTRRLLFPGPRPSPLSLNRPALPPQLHHINPSPRRCTSHLQCVPLAPRPVIVNDAIEFCSLERSDIVLSKQEAVAKRAKSLITTSEQGSSHDSFAKKSNS
ncbi:hypothetical protein VDGE_30771 [Verticillium dahliae]|uniref:Uncharacterized protein n=1 Tax=Verticillium dahliae TaxID=27337 RepID=A0A444S061_VERDA|nr:hypothetical protein VDGE_30771 [Verticillium dahliae]